MTFGKENIMKKSLLAATAAASGAIIFASAAIANYTTANGYEVVKDSLFGLFGTENYTLDLGISMYTNDGYGTSIDNHLEIDDASNSNYMCETYLYNFPGSEESDKYQRWRSGKLSVFQSDDDVPTGHYVDGVYSSNIFASDSFGGDEDTQTKILHFIEVAVDTAAGDLKNNFIYTGTSEEGLKTYSLSLDAIQIPELLNAGLSAMVSVAEDDYDNTSHEDLTEEELWVADLVTMDNVYTDSISGVFTVNEDNSFNSGEVSAIVTGKDANGEVHDITFKAKLNMSNVGTTVPQAIPENTRMLNTPDYEPVDTEAVG